MSVFRTPLFAALAGLLVFLAVIGRFGFFDHSPREKVALSSQYALAQGVFEQNIGKVWIVKLDRIGSEKMGDQSRAMMVFADSDMLLDLRISAGAHWRGWVRPLKERTGYRGLPSSDDWLGRYGAAMRLSVDRADDLDVFSLDKGVMALLFRLKTAAARRLRGSFNDSKVAGLLGGLILGEKRLLDSSLKKEFADVGVAHLLVVSGMHVSLWAAMIWALAMYVLRLGAKKASLVSGVVTWAFAAGVGLTPPVIRSAVMMSFLMAAPLLRRELPAIARLLAAAFVMLMIRPQWVMDASFQLSLAATFGVLYGWETLGHWWAQYPAWARFVIGIFTTSFFAWYAVWPISAAWFHQVSVVGPLANVVLIPASGVLLAMGVLQLLVVDWIPYVDQLGHGLLELAAYWFLGAVQWLDRWPWAAIGQGSWLWWQYAFWVLGLMAPLTHFWQFRKKLLIAIAVLAAIAVIDRQMSAPKVYLLSGYSGLEAVYEERGWSRRLCVEQENDGQSTPARLREFLIERGAQKIKTYCSQGLLDGEYAPSWWPASPWSGHQRQPVFRCVNETIIYPLTPIVRDSAAQFGIIADEPSSVTLQCSQGHFVEVIS